MRDGEASIGCLHSRFSISQHHTLSFSHTRLSISGSMWVTARVKARVCVCETETERDRKRERVRERQG